MTTATKREPCPRCAPGIDALVPQRGRVRCMRCDGVGHEPGGRGDCERCGGVGTEDCYECSGTGEMGATDDE